MPAERHDEYIKSYYEKGSFEFSQPRRIFEKTKEGYLTSLTLSTKLLPYSEMGFCIIGIVKKVNTSSEFILITEAGIIEGATNFKTHGYQ